MRGLSKELKHEFVMVDGRIEMREDFQKDSRLEQRLRGQDE